MVELSPDFKFTLLDAKQALNRYYAGVESKLFTGIKKIQPYRSATGFPYGRYVSVLNPGDSCQVTLTGNAFAFAWVDTAKGGDLQITVDGKKLPEIPTNKPYIMQSKEKLFMENRKGFEGIPFGVHTITVKAVKAPVTFMGVYSYDTRSNSAWQRIVRGSAADGEFIFSPAFKARPVIHCSGTLKVKSATAEKVVFTGNGTFTASGE